MIILTFFTTYEVFEFVLFKIIENTLHLFHRIVSINPKNKVETESIATKKYEPPYKEMIIYKK